jgi:hypothetical protein
MQNIKAARRAAKHEPRLYSVWGTETPVRTSNVHSLYRYGDMCMWCRYIVAPRPTRLLEMGWTIGDTVVLLAVLAFIGLLVHVFGIGFDSYADLMGW